MSRLWRRLRRNAGSVAVVLARDAVRPKNLLGLLGLAVGLGALGQSAVALSGGQVVSTAVFGAAAAVSLYGGGTSLLGNPLRGATVFVGGLLLVGGTTHALGVGPADTSTDTVEDSEVTYEGSYASVGNPEVGRVPPREMPDDETDDDTEIGAHHGGGCGGAIAP